MKKVVSLFLAVVMLISVFAGFGVTAQAEEKRDAWIEYEVNSDGRTATITAITGTEVYAIQYLDLPTTVDEGKYTVTAIGDYAFYGNTYINEVTIPDTVKSIGEYAFYGCNNLLSVDLGNGALLAKTPIFMFPPSLGGRTVAHSL